MIQFRPWWWRLLHPIQWSKIKERNNRILDDMGRVAFEVFDGFDSMIENGVAFDEEAALYYLKNQLQKEIYKVLLYHEASK